MILRFEELADWMPAMPNRGIMVQILTSCTAAKGDRRLPAEDLYEGQQHLKLMRGVTALRSSGRARWVRLDIISARHGMIHGESQVEPYERTFSGMGRVLIRRRAEELNIPSRAAFWMANALPDLKLVLLGNEYLQATAFDFKVQLESPTIVMCSKSASPWFPDVRNLAVVPLGNADASRYGAGLVSLKGELAARLLEMLAHDVRYRPGGIDGHSPDTAALQAEVPGQAALRSHGQ